MLRGRLNRFVFTPGRVLESGASWNRERRHLARPLRSVFFYWLHDKPCGFQRSPGEPCSVARFLWPLIVVTSNKGLNDARAPHTCSIRPKEPTQPIHFLSDTQPTRAMDSDICKHVKLSKYNVSSTLLHILMGAELLSFNCINIVKCATALHSGQNGAELVVKSRSDGHLRKPHTASYMETNTFTKRAVVPVNHLIFHLNE